MEKGRICSSQCQNPLLQIYDTPPLLSHASSITAKSIKLFPTQRKKASPRAAIKPFAAFALNL
jgi:hypothetical protein